MEPQAAFLRRWPPALAAWSAGGLIDHAISYDAGPKDMRRGKDIGDTELDHFDYPLRDWGWERERCKEEILADTLLGAIAKRHGVPHLPPKSACVCCPSTQAWEVDAMAESEPQDLAAALAIESAALPTLRAMDGLWRRPTASRPGSWIAYAAEHHPTITPRTADQVAPCLTPCADPDISGAPPDDARYAIKGTHGEINFVARFSDGLRLAGDGPLHAWIGGAWFTSHADRTPISPRPFAPQAGTLAG